MEKARVILQGEEARKAILKGVNAVGDVVRSTLGPQGRNCMIDRDWRSPRITNDGVTIAKNIHLEDEAENVAAQTFIQAADRTNEDAGDGTTTSIVLAQKLVSDVFSKLSNGIVGGSSFNPMQAYRDIDEAKNQALDLLKKKAKPVKDNLADVASISLEDDKLGKVVADMVEKVGKDGYIGVEQGFTKEVETDVITGMKVNGKYINKALATNNRREAIYENALIVITDEQLDKKRIGDFDKWLQGLAKATTNRSIVFMCPKFDKEFQDTILATTLAPQSHWKILGVKIPALTPDEITDMAVYTGAVFASTERQMTFDQLAIRDLGTAKRLVVDDDHIIIMGGGGEKKAVDAHIEKLKGNQEAEKDEMFKKKIGIRIASMASGIGLIKVGARTEAEMGYLKLKLEDAVFATKAALEEGVVAGGGKALYDIANELPENILTETLKAPYNQIQENAGGSLKIGKKVIDPVKVTRTALENACSVAKTMITTDSIIAEKRDRPLKELEAILKETIHHEVYIPE